MAQWSGILISFEGGEGSGKSTQVNWLHAHLRSHGFDAIVVRNPGASRIGERVRAILLDPDSSDISPRAEVFLHAASFSQNLRELIIPSLASGKVVICDRYTDSALAYQGVVRGAGQEFVERVILQEATEGVCPDLTIYIDLPAHQVEGRTSGKRPPAEARVENEPLAFHQAVRDAYLKIAMSNLQRIRVIDGAQLPEKVSEDIAQIVFPLLHRTLGNHQC